MNKTIPFFIQELKELQKDHELYCDLAKKHKDKLNFEYEMGWLHALGKVLGELEHFDKSNRKRGIGDWAKKPEVMNT